MTKTNIYEVETYLLETATGEDFEKLIEIFQSFEDALDRVERHFHFMEKQSKSLDCIGKKVFNEKKVLLVRQDWIEELFNYRTKNFNLSSITIKEIETTFNTMMLDLEFIIGGFFKKAEPNCLYIGGSIKWDDERKCYIANHIDLTLTER